MNLRQRYLQKLVRLGNRWLTKEDEWMMTNYAAMAIIHAAYGNIEYAEELFDEFVRHVTTNHYEDSKDGDRRLHRLDLMVGLVDKCIRNSKRRFWHWKRRNRWITLKVG